MRGDPEPVGAGYYHAMGIVLREGRELTETNRSESVLIAIVNEAFAKEFFPKGRRLGNESSRIGPTRRPRRSLLSAGELHLKIPPAVEPLGKLPSTPGDSCDQWEIGPLAQRLGCSKKHMHGEMSS